MDKPNNSIDLDILFQDEFDFKGALQSPFLQPKWWAKLLLPALIIVLSIAAGFLMKPLAALGVLLLLVAMVLSIAYAGFVVQFQHNEIHGQSPLLSDIKGNVKKFVKLALKNWVVAIVYVLAIDAIGLLVFGGVYLGGAGLLAIPFGVFAILLVFCMWILANGIFADTFCIKSALNFKKSFALVRVVKLEIFMLFLFLISLSIMVHISVFLLAITVLGLAITPFVLVAQMLIGANATAQLYKIAKCRIAEQKA